MYTSFAYVYDKFMDNIPYDEWIQYIEKLWIHYDLKPNLVLDLACGTGEVTCRFADKGYDMIGIDLSHDMLDVARNKAEKKNLDILFLEQDMCQFELYGTVDSILCVCDGMNYLQDEDELLKVFKLANNYLDPKGLLIFDMNTAYKYETLGEGTYTDIQEDCAYIWENNYNKNDQINEYYLTIFNKEVNGHYERHEEYHCQKAYKTQQIIHLLRKAGLEPVAVYDAFTFNEPSEESERIYFIAREVKKERKK